MGSALDMSVFMLERYSWARVDVQIPLPGAGRLKCHLSAGHISELCRGKCQYLCYSPVPSAGGVVQIADA